MILVKVHRKLCCVNVESGEWWVEMSILWSCGSRQPHWWLVATTGTGWWLSPSCTPNLVKDKIQWKCEGGNNSHFTKLSNNRINKNEDFMDCWLLISFVVSQNAKQNNFQYKVHFKKCNTYFVGVSSFILGNNSIAHWLNKDMAKRKVLQCKLVLTP